MLGIINNIIVSKGKKNYTVGKKSSSIKTNKKIDYILNRNQVKLIHAFY